MGKMKKLKARLKTKKRLKIRRRHPQCLSPTPNYTEDIHENLKIFDKLFSEFEFSYVSCMVHVKTVKGKKSLKLLHLTLKLGRVRDPAGCDLLVLRHPAEGDQQPDDHTGHGWLLRPKVRAKKTTAKLLQSFSAAWCSPSHGWRSFAAWWSSPPVPSTWNETPRTFQSSSGEILRLPSTTFAWNSKILIAGRSRIFCGRSGTCCWLLPLENSLCSRDCFASSRSPQTWRRSYRWQLLSHLISVFSIQFRKTIQRLPSPS